MICLISEWINTPIFNLNKTIISLTTSPWWCKSKMLSSTKYHQGKQHKFNVHIIPVIFINIYLTFTCAGWLTLFFTCFEKVKFPAWLRCYGSNWATGTHYCLPAWIHPYAGGTYIYMGWVNLTASASTHDLAQNICHYKSGLPLVKTGPLYVN